MENVKSVVVQQQHGKKKTTVFKTTQRTKSAHTNTKGNDHTYLL